MQNSGNQRRQEVRGLNQLAYKTNQTLPQRGFINRTNSSAQSNKAQNTGGTGPQGTTSQAQNRSFNAPMIARHKSPNQTGLQYPPQGAQMRAPQNSSSVEQKYPQAVKGRPSQVKSGSQAPHGQRIPNQNAQQQQRNQYQPSLMFKPGQAKQQFEHLKQGRSEPEIVSYQSQQPQAVIQHQLNAAPMVGYPGGYPPQNWQHQQLQGGFQPQFASNQSPYGRHENTYLEGAQTGAENQHPYPRQFPYESNKATQQQANNSMQQRRQPFASPDQRQRPDAKKKSPQRIEQGRGNMPLQMRQQQQQRLAGPTHQMRAYETAPSDQVAFYPPQQIEAQKPPQTIQEDDFAEADNRFNLPRKTSPVKDDSGDEDQIRQMQNLLAEIGADVSELKKRPPYNQNINSSEPRSSAKRTNKIYQSSKSNSKSPESHKLSRSRLSNSQEGTYPPQASGQNDLQHRSMSPQARSNSQGTGAGNRASSQSRKNAAARLSPQQLLQVRSAAQTGASDSKQWTSPNDNTRLTATAAPQIHNPTPSHTNTMSLTVSVNPDHNQERLFRLSPLSSKMQEDTDGEEQSNSQRLFNLNQSINNSQLDSSSPDNQTRQQHPVTLGASQSSTIIQEINRGNEAPTRTFEDDDEEIVSAIPGGPTATPDEKLITFDERDASMQVISQLPYSEERPVLRASALADSTAAPRTDTPLASEVISEAAQSRDLHTNSRAFSRSSNRRGGADDKSITDALGHLAEGPKRVQVKEKDCQTDPVQDSIKEKVIIKEAPAPPKAATRDQDSQTFRRDFAPIQLSPFDTYDLFFVKELVNNLNQDNEVLVDSNQDLKYAFHFLLQKHKQLQQELEREKAKNSLFEQTKKRLETVTEERDKALEQGLHLGNKVETMSRVMRLAVDEQAHLEEQAELMMSQLEEENKSLRSLLKISEQFSEPVTQNALTETISAIEKKQQEMAYEADRKLREHIKGECQAEFDNLKKELPGKIESELKVKYDAQTKELETMYEAKLIKQEEETAILKKTLLEQSLQRLQTIQQQHGVEDGSEESNSLEGSYGLHHFSSNSEKKAAMPAGSDQLQLSSSFSSKNNNSVVMQQDLDEFRMNACGDLTEAEQDLISQLTANAMSKQTDKEPEKATLAVSPESKMSVNDLNQAALKDEPRQSTEMQAKLDRGFQAEADEDDDDDDYMDDFGQFGEEAKSPKDRHNLIQVVTTRKSPQDKLPEPQEAQTVEPSAFKDWDFNGGISSDLFERDDRQPDLREAQNQQPFPQDQDVVENEDDDLNNDPFYQDLHGFESPMQKMDAKMNEQEPNVDLFKLDGADDNDDGPDSKERAELLSQNFDDFFSEESDKIMDDLIDGESSDSDTEGPVDSKQFEELYQKSKSAESAKNTKAAEKDSEATSTAIAASQITDAKSPTQSQPLKQSAGSEQSNSSERHNKYKRGKRNSGDAQTSKTQTAAEEESKSTAKHEKRGASPKSSAFGEQQQTVNDEFDDFIADFNPPEAASSNIIAQDFDDHDFWPSEPISGSSQASSNLMDKGFYGNWDDDDDENNLFGPSDPYFKSGDIDEEDRRFFEELSKGFSNREEPQPQQESRNDQMDDTRATRQMLAAHREAQKAEQEDLGELDWDAPREEAKEDEYDYFDSAVAENQGNAQGYHVIDEADLQEDEEDLEELTEEEKDQRHREMIKEFKEQLEREDSRASRSPRHKPRM